MSRTSKYEKNLYAEIVAHFTGMQQVSFGLTEVTPLPKV